MINLFYCAICIILNKIQSLGGYGTVDYRSALKGGVLNFNDSSSTQIIEYSEKLPKFAIKIKSFTSGRFFVIHVVFSFVFEHPHGPILLNQRIKDLFHSPGWIQKPTCSRTILKRSVSILKRSCSASIAAILRRSRSASCSASLWAYFN